MQNKDNLKEFAALLSKFLEKFSPKNKEDLNSLKLEVCRILKTPEMPTDPDIYKFLPKKFQKKYKEVFSIKKTKSLSGIVAVAIMPKPYPCPFSCIYCPNSLVGKDTPKSYTGGEPATMRALNSNFSAKKQISSRLKQIKETGHSIDKIELIIMGGTFLSLPLQYRNRFMLSSYSAIAGKNLSSLKSAKKELIKSKIKLTALTFETRPDVCSNKDISWMLNHGATRIELGVQIPDNSLYSFINRGHTREDVIDATQRLKDSGFKITYHMMLGLQSPSKDKKSFKELFDNPDFKPDALKIYPTLVLPNTKLFQLWKTGKYKPLSLNKATSLLTDIKENIPYYVRIMRIQRDIPSTVVSAGPNKTNLRQIVKKHMSKQGKKCKCIRCREISRTNSHPKNPKLFIEKYKASRGTEFFISYESKDRTSLLGLVRLRFPYSPFRKELKDAAIIRELRVFGKSTPLGKKEKESYQHKGIGKLLMQKAEEIAQKKYSKLSVISGWGVINYYKKLGYKIDGAYVSKKF